MARTGNQVANAYREARLNPADRPSTNPLELESFIRRKVCLRSRQQLSMSELSWLRQEDVGTQMGKPQWCKAAKGALCQRIYIAGLGQDLSTVCLTKSSSGPVQMRCSLCALLPICVRVLQYNGDFAEGDWPPPDSQEPLRTSRTQPFTMAVGEPCSEVMTSCSGFGQLMQPSGRAGSHLHGRNMPRPSHEPQPALYRCPMPPAPCNKHSTVALPSPSTPLHRPAPPHCSDWPQLAAPLTVPWLCSPADEWPGQRDLRPQCLPAGGLPAGFWAVCGIRLRSQRHGG